MIADIIHAFGYKRITEIINQGIHSLVMIYKHSPK